MRRVQISNVANGILRLVDASGWQKWFEVAVLRFAFALDSTGDYSLIQFQGLAIGIPLILCYIQAVNDCFDVEIDEIKEKLQNKPLIVSKVVSQTSALTITFLILLIGLLSAWMSTLDFLLYHA